MRRSRSRSLTSVSVTVGEDLECDGQRQASDDSEVEVEEDDDGLGDLENEIDQEVKVNKKEATSFSMSDADKDELAEMIARKIIEKQNEEKERKEAKEKLAEVWDEGTDFLSCQVCAMFKEHHQVPPKMLRSRKNDFGLIGKQGKDGNIRSRRELMRSAKMHADTDLHQWCFRKAEIHQKEEKTFEDTNEDVAKNIFRAALKNLKRGLGAQDFMADMDYLY